MSEVHFYRVKDWPKTPEAAKRLWIQVSLIGDSTSKRRKNIMDNISQHQAKIKQLGEKQKSLEEAVEAIDASDPHLKETLRKLQIDSTLTEAELIEAKSAFLRSEIDRQQAALEHMTVSKVTDSEG